MKESSTDNIYVVITPDGKKFKTHGHLHKKLFGGTVLSSAFGTVAVIPREWAIIRYDMSFTDLQGDKK